RAPLQPSMRPETIQEATELALRGSAMHLYNLIFAIIWLVLGLGLLAYDHLAPGGAAPFRIGDTDVSLGWIALALAAYNIVRWWSRRASWRARKQEEKSERRRERARREREFRESGRTPDPNFIFDKPPDDTDA